MTTTEGAVRAARITDRQALVELSRRVHTAADSYRRSLGVPAPSGVRCLVAGLDLLFAKGVIAVFG